MSATTAAGVVRRDSARLALAAGVALLCAGMAVAVAGVLVPGLFLPGVVVLDLGCLALVVALFLSVRPAAVTAAAAGG